MLYRCVSAVVSGKRSPRKKELALRLSAVVSGGRSRQSAVRCYKQVTNKKWMLTTTWWLVLEFFASSACFGSEIPGRLALNFMKHTRVERTTRCDSQVRESTPRVLCLVGRDGHAFQEAGDTGCGRHAPSLWRRSHACVNTST